MRLMSSMTIASVLVLAGINISNADDNKSINIWNWSYNIGENTVAQFASDTGLVPNYVEFDSNELQEARLLSGNTGFDASIVVSYNVPRMSSSGALMKIDHSKIPNWAKLNNARMQKMASIDPNNDYAYPYIEIHIGIGYNKQKIQELFGPDYKVESWDFLFNKDNSDKLKKCGIAVLDSPIEIISAVQVYLNKDPRSENKEDYEQAQELLTELAGNTAYFQSNRYVQDLAAGEICAVIGYSGDIIQARHLSEQAQTGFDIEYVIPKEGTIYWFDSWTVPKGAKNYDNAMTWFNWLLEPEHASKLSDEIGYILPVDEAMAQLADELRNNESIMLTDDKLDKMYFMQAPSQKVSRITTSLWNSMKLAADNDWD